MRDELDDRCPECLGDGWIEQNDYLAPEGYKRVGCPLKCKQVEEDGDEG